MINSGFEQNPFPVGEIKARIRRGEDFSQEERTKKDYWPMYDSGKDRYWLEFRRVLSPEFESLEQLVKALRVRKGGSIAALDLLGTGRVLEELGIEKALAVSLAKPDYLPERKTEILAGDILKRDTWQKVKAWLNKNGEKGFDLVLCKPGGAFYPSSDTQTYPVLFKRLWPMVNPGGIFLVQLDPVFVSKIPSFLKKLKGRVTYKYLSVSESEWGDPVIMLKK